VCGNLRACALGEIDTPAGLSMPIQGSLFGREAIVFGESSNSRDARPWQSGNIGAVIYLYSFIYLSCSGSGHPQAQNPARGGQAGREVGS